MSDRVGGYIQTYSGGRAWLLDPRPEDIRLLDIAHALSMVCRFGGHSRYHYSVARHSVLVSTICSKENALIGLLHDASEAYVGDVVSPFKADLGGYKEIEKRWCLAIGEAFGLGNRLVDMPKDVHDADTLAGAAEAYEVLIGGPHQWDMRYMTDSLRDKSAEIRVFNDPSPQHARDAFLARFSEITRTGVH